MSGALGDAPDTMETWMRGQQKSQQYLQRQGNKAPLIALNSALRIDRLVASVSLPNAAAGDGTDVVLTGNLINTIDTWLTYSSTTGYYTALDACLVEFTPAIAYASSATGGRATRLWWRPTGGGTWYEQVSHNNAPGIGGTYTMFMPITVPLANGDQVKFTARQNSGGALDMLGATTWPTSTAGNYSTQVAARMVAIL